MRKLLFGRLAALVPILPLASFAMFMLIQLAPGDPAIILAGEHASAEQIEIIREREGLDRPVLVQYGDWLVSALQGDLGRSMTTRASVASEIGRTLPLTVQLVAGALVVAVVVGISAGVAAAQREDTRLGGFITSAAAAGAAMPSFWLGLVLVSIFALQLGWLPATGFVGIGDDPALALQQLILPAIALGIAGAAEIARQLRSVMSEVLSSDHVRTLRAKGLDERKVVWRHAMKGSGVPIMTVVGLQVSNLLGATVVVEAAFGIGGMGNLVATAAQNRDYPVVQGVVVVIIAMVVLVNFVVDVSYRIFDPRIR